MPSVLEPWMDNISLKAQAVILSALRRPDGVDLPKLGEVVRFIRSVALIDSCPGQGTFMKGSIPLLDKDFEKEISRCNVHAILHIAHALEIIGYFYPQKIDAEMSLQLYFDICDMFHMNVEMKEQLKIRLQDGIVSNCWK